MTDTERAFAMLTSLVLSVVAPVSAFGLNNPAEKRVKSKIKLCNGAAENGLMQISRFLANLEISRCSPLSTYQTSKIYHDRTAKIDRAWRKMAANQRSLARWWRQHARGTHAKRVFYPFSGPDISNALILYPNARVYNLFGLEPTGPIPRVQEYTDLIRSGIMPEKLQRAETALQSILSLNFFQTKKMRKNFHPSSRISLTEIFLFLLAKHQARIYSVRPIGITESGKVVLNRKATSQLTRGTSITFSLPGRSNKQVMRYFTLNAKDPFLRQNHKGLVSYIRSHRMATLLKAASYLMHYGGTDPFQGIRGLILDVSKVVVQDTSGVPIRHFLKQGWNIRTYGIYKNPIPLFRVFHQPKMVEFTRKNVPLDFSWGYTGGRDATKSVLIMALPPNSD